MTGEFPDIAKAQLSDGAKALVLQRVGMAKIEMPIRLGEDAYLANGLVSAYVSLDEPLAKGIHMSRLYLIVKEQLSRQSLTPKLLKNILLQFISSHEGISQSAFLELRFELPAERLALKSGYEGYRRYPVCYRASLHGAEFDLQMSFEVLYSSTCPCSAALSRQLIQEGFLAQFQDRQQIDVQEVAKWLAKEEAIAATPHGQRSLAEITVIPAKPLQAPSFLDLIDHVEQALQTPVQSAVKRPDEQEFARLNAKNLMFAEDAARRIGGALNALPAIRDFRAKVSHVESLHPHDAVAIVTKGEDSSKLSVGW
ncbi:MAG: GTP cyclohydrolase FolE2 [Oligoflexus sp.]